MRKLVLTCAVLTALPLFGAEVFDVPKEEEKKADARLPENVRKVLDRLTASETADGAALEKRIIPIRTALKDRLLALSGKADGQEKLDLVALGKSIEGMTAREVLRPETITLSEEAGKDTGGWIHKGKPWTALRPNGTVNTGTGGTWRWLNKKHTIFVVGFPDNPYANVIFLNSPQALEAIGINYLGNHYPLTRKTAVDGTVRKPSASGLRLVVEAAASEAALRAATQKQITKRRAGIAAWLIEQAKTATPAVAALLLAEAQELSAAGNAHELEQQPGRFAGVWVMDNGTKLEFKPGGTFVSTKLGEATWTTSKISNRGTALILFGKPDDPADAWIARISNSEPGVLRIDNRDNTTTARLEKP